MWGALLGNSAASGLETTSQVQDAPLPRLGDTLNARVPWYGDAQPASQVCVAVDAIESLNAARTLCSASPITWLQ